MKHHFGDLLDRDAGYWNIAPNRERWAYHFEDWAEAPEDLSIATVTKADKNWRRILEFQNLAELTLHEASKEQLGMLEELPRILRLRITHARPKTLDVLANLERLEELVLEYVSGFERLEPVGQLPSLTSLHIENVRRVSDFSGLVPGRMLRYLSIYGTLDWNQPVESLDFLAGLEKLEYLGLAWVRILQDTPALSALRQTKHMKKVSIGMNALPLEDFAYLEAACPHIAGAVRPAYVMDKKGDSAFLLGKGTRTLQGKPENVAAKCRAHEAEYRKLVDRYMDELQPQ